MTNSAITSSRPSHRPRRPAIRAAIGHAPQLSSPYRFPSPRGFPSTPRRPSVYPLSLLRLVLRLEGRLVSIYIELSILAVFVISPRRVLLVGSCSFRLIVRRRYRHINIIPYIHRILVSLYPCIFYIHRIHHIHYIHQSTRHDKPHDDIQASSRRPASRPARLESNERHEARAIATGNEKQATMSQMGDAARPHAPQP